jgi:hypothetical protein
MPFLRSERYLHLANDDLLILQLLSCVRMKSVRLLPTRFGVVADWQCCCLSRIVCRLVDTGQGYQRLQQCPHVRQEMSRILHTVQSSRGVGSWVGLSVVHLGDRDVPNGELCRPACILSSVSTVVAGLDVHGCTVNS